MNKPHKPAPIAGKKLTANLDSTNPFDEKGHNMSISEWDKNLITESNLDYVDSVQLNRESNIRDSNQLVQGQNLLDKSVNIA